jgi:cell division septum initiation protein DivIVA
LPLSADSIENPHLPRARVGGYSVEATDEFLARVADEYRQLQRDRADLLTRQADLERRLQKILLAVDSDGDPWLPGREPELPSTDLLAAAHRAAADLRAQARAECETMLKKARRRADSLEHEVEQVRKRSEHRVRELEETQRQARERLSSFLASMIAAFEDRSDDVGSVVRELRARTTSAGELR